MGRGRGALVAVLAAIAGACLAAPPAHAGDTIFHPLRWCAIEGSRAVANPPGVGEQSTNDVLWRRHERATDVHWVPGAGISFRSAFTREVADRGQFPRIRDPRPPAAGGPGALGDVEYPSGNEWRDAIAACRTAWSALDTQFGTHFPGQIVVNARKLVESDGSDSFPGFSCYGCIVYGTRTFEQVCDALRPANPPQMSIDEASAFTMVWDNEFTGSPPAPGDTLLAHEIGHVLFLAHGNGEDDDRDGLFDEGCDPDETSTTPRRLMHPGGGSGITELHRKVARAFALGSPGGRLDPPGVLNPGDNRGDDLVDRFADVQEARVDLTGLGLVRDAGNKTMTITHALADVIDGKEPTDYVAFLDADGDPATGGAPRELDFDTDFEGAELVTAVSTAPGRRARQVTETRAWRFRDGGFEEIRGVRAAIHRTFPSHPHDAEPLFERVETVLPIDAVDVDPEGAAAGALAIDSATGEVDELPDNRKVSDKLYLAPAEFPVCAADGAEAGGTATVTAEGLVAERGAHIVLGDREVGKADIDGKGALEAEFEIPRRVKDGPHLVTVGVDETAITADCIIEVGARDADDGGCGPAGLGTVLTLMLGLVVVRRVHLR